MPELLENNNLIEERLDKNITLIENSLKQWDESHQFLVNFINKRSSEIQVGLEVGVCFGGNMDSILSKTNIKKMIGVDPYVVEGWDLFVNVDECFGSFDDLYKAVYTYLNGKYGKRMQLIRSTSENASKKIKNGSLDFVFIDGDHSDFPNDISYWEKKVRSGGYIMGHDWNHPNYGGIQQFLKSYYTKEELKVNEKADVWCVQKK